jgi:type II secretory pathway component HofQ
MYTGRRTLLTLIVIAAIMVCATLASAQTSGTPSELDKRVTLQFKDVPIGNAIAILFEGINHVVEPGVQGSVTLSLNDVPFNDALQAMLKAAGMTARKENNVYYIGPRRELPAETAALASVVPETEVQVERSKIPEKIKIGYGDATEIGSYLGAQIGGMQRNQMMGGGMGGGMQQRW